MKAIINQLVTEQGVDYLVAKQQLRNHEEQLVTLKSDRAIIWTKDIIAQLKEAIAGFFTLDGFDAYNF